MSTALDVRPVEAKQQPTQSAPAVGRRDRHSTTEIAWQDRRWFGSLLAAVVAVVAGWAFTRGISTPWPWSDEGATYLALHRSWDQLLVLYRGPDAPLVPYYFLAKGWTGAVQAFWPQTSILTGVRLLSAAAGCATVVVLYALVARNAGRLAGLLTGLLLVSLPGFDRLAQEGRPYTLLALAATSSWLMWDRWLRPGVRPSLWTAQPKDVTRNTRTALRAIPAAVGYLTSLATLGFIHTFGLFQWPAQLLATALTRAARPWRRLSVLALTALLFLLAGLLVAGQTLATIAHGTGSLSPSAARLVDGQTITTQVLRGAFLSTKLAVIAPVLVLAVLGVIASRRQLRFAIGLAVWLLVPLVMELGLSVVKTNLFRSRYWVADLPPLAALAGLGLLAIARAVNVLVGRLSGEGRIGFPSRAVAVVLKALGTGAVVAGLLSLQVTLQAPAQNHLRSLHGHHGEDLAPVLGIIDRTMAEHQGLRVLVSSGAASGILGAARPQLQDHNPLRGFDPAVPTVFTVPAGQATVRADLGKAKELLWIFRGALDAPSAAARIPHGLAGLHLHVRWAVPAGHTWTAILLQPGTPSIGTTTTGR